MLTPAHIHIVCRDLESMVAFWKDALGARFVMWRDFGGKKGAVMDCGGVSVYFKADPRAEPLQSGMVGYEHFGFTCVDLEQELERLVHNFGCELVSLRPRQKPGLYTAFVRGPENLLFEIMQQE